MAPPVTSRASIGWLKTPQASAHQLLRSGDGSSFGPPAANRRSASSVVSPGTVAIVMSRSQFVTTAGRLSQIRPDGLDDGGEERPNRSLGQGVADQGVTDRADDAQRWAIHADDGEPRHRMRRRDQWADLEVGCHRWEQGSARGGLPADRYAGAPSV